MNSKPHDLRNNLEENTSEFLKYLVKNGGPELKDYERFTSIVNRIDPAEVDNFREKLIQYLMRTLSLVMDL